MIDLKQIPKLVINLDRRKDRLAKFGEEFSAFFGNDCSFTRVQAERGTPAMKFIAMSHRKAVTMAKAMGAECACIMEDDVRFTSERSFGYAQTCFADTPSEWDFLFGGVLSQEDGDVYHDWVSLKDFSGMHFYVIHSRAYDRFIAMSSDMHIDRWVASENFVRYTTRKIFATQHSGFSDNARKHVEYERMVDNRNFV